MHVDCTACKLRYERAPGYFLGSAYINYGITSLGLTAAYLVLHIGWGFSNRVLIGPLAAFFVVFPLYFFRYARSLWLALDYQLDPTGFESGSE